MPIDALVAAAIINRWIAVPLLAAVWAFGHASSEFDQDFIEGFVVAAVYGAIGYGVRRLLEAELRDFIAERRASDRQEHHQ